MLRYSGVFPIDTWKISKSLQQKSTVSGTKGTMLLNPVPWWTALGHVLFMFYSGHIFGLFHGFRALIPTLATWIFHMEWMRRWQVLGLFGDYLVLHSHGLGRRMFLRIGVIMAAIGILICMLWLGGDLKKELKGKDMGVSIVMGGTPK